MNLFTQHTEFLNTLLSQLPHGSEGWLPSRLIFYDWWHWRYTAFHFAQGRLALTGMNESGKSTLLALLIPVLLDGDTSPRRLDPSLTQDRQLAWFLLGPDSADPDNPNGWAHHARIGYVALEFQHADGRVLTIGFGVEASRSVQGKIRGWWGFVIPRLRLGPDLDLDLHGDDGICLKPDELNGLLNKRLGDTHGDSPTCVFPDRDEYRQQVNAALFGMSEDDYRGLIGLLLQARRPNLNVVDRDSVTRVCGWLRDSLPAVPVEQFAIVSSVVQNLEEHQRNLKSLSERVALLASLDSALLDLAEAKVQLAAQSFESAHNRFARYSQEYQEAETKRRRAENQLVVVSDRTAAFKTQLAVAKAKLATLAVSEPEIADLPRRLSQAKAESVQARANYNQALEFCEEIQGQIQAGQATLQTLEDHFVKETRQLASRLQRLAGNAGTNGWTEGESALRVAATDTVTLSIDEPVDQTEAVQPDPVVLSRLTPLTRLYRQLADTLRQLAAARDHYTEISKQLSELRVSYEKGLRSHSQAREALQALHANMDGAIESWQSRYQSLAMPAHTLGTIRRTVAGWAEGEPAQGHELTALVRAHARERQQQLQNLRTPVEKAYRDAAAAADARRAEHAELAQRGLVPFRSPVRTAARENATARPLYGWVRFRPDLSEGVANLVEAAGFEANLLDILVASPDEQSTADAWLLADEPAPNRSVLAVLEAEADAPPRVASILARIGWGAGQGNTWLSPDGCWRHGSATGQVASWASTPWGLVGTERRHAALQQQLAALQDHIVAADVRTADAKQELDSIDTALAALAEAETAFDSLPFGELLAAANTLRQLHWQLQSVEAAYEAFKPKEETARLVLRELEETHGQLLGRLPAARGLDTEATDRRIEACQTLESNLASLGPAYEAVARLMAEHQQSAARLKGHRETLGTWAQQQEQLLRRLEVTHNTVATCEQQLANPNIQIALQQQNNLYVEIEQVDQELEQLDGARITALDQHGRADERLTQINPLLDESSTKRNQELAFLRQQLRLHSAHADMLALLEEKGEVSALPHMPRPVANSDEAILKSEIAQRHARVVEQIRDCEKSKTLSEYRPTPDATLESITFYDEYREPLTPPELQRRFIERKQNSERLIARHEQQLYEDIICEKMLDVLQRLLHQAHTFKEKTNAALKRLRSSSSEYLSLRFTLLPVNEVPGAAIGRALEASAQDVRWLSAEQRAALVEQIRAEVNRVRQEAAVAGKQVAYFTAISTALDYRNWYSFHLESHKPGEPVHEIRDKGFGTRSNSARAWALAAPIIAGVAARYDASPRPDAPRLIGLDEIIAGYDPANQIRYLRYLQEMRLAWIITLPDDVPYTRHLPAVMSYYMERIGTTHTATPSLWDGQTFHDPLDYTGAHEAAAGLLAEPPAENNPLTDTKPEGETDDDDR